MDGVVFGGERLRFEGVKARLDDAGIVYRVNPRLVRGLDYYNNCVFAWTTDKLGAQSAVCGGGRYDGLAEDIGGPSTPGVGFGSGIERIILALRELGVEPPTLEAPRVFIANFGGDTKRAAVRTAFALRDAGIGARMAFARTRRSMKSQMREANKYDVAYVLIFGESELEAGEVTVRAMDGSGQEVVKLAELVAWLQERL